MHLGEQREWRSSWSSDRCGPWLSKGRGICRSLGLEHNYKKGGEGSMRGMDGGVGGVGGGGVQLVFCFSTKGDPEN